MKMVKGYKTHAEMIREVVKELGSATPRAIMNFIGTKYPEIEVKENSFRADIIGCSVNHTSSHHYPGMPKFLFYEREKRTYRLYDPEKNGKLVVDDESEEISTKAVTSLERDFEEYIVRNLNQIENGLELYSNEGITGRQFEPITEDKKIESKRNIDKDLRVKFLLEFGKTIKPQELFPVLVDGAASLIEENPFAFALATVLDRGTKSEVIWTIPYYLQKEIGELNPEFFVGKTIDEIEKIFQKLPLKPRYMNDAPRSIKELSEIVANEFNGDASEIWKNRSSKEVKTTFQRVHGVGPGISSMAVLLLERCFGIQFNDIDHRNMDVKPDIHVIRVFGRLGFISQLNEKEALNAARELNPEYPGALDTPIWIIGRKWCTADVPQCTYCPVNEVCSKIIHSGPKWGKNNEKNGN